MRKDGRSVGAWATNRPIGVHKDGVGSTLYLTKVDGTVKKGKRSLGVECGRNDQGKRSSDGKVQSKGHKLKMQKEDEKKKYNSHSRATITKSVCGI